MGRYVLSWFYCVSIVQGACSRKEVKVSSFVKGEVLVFTDHYDLFDVDMYKKEVMFYKYVSENTKCLVMYPKTGEWGEPKVESLRQKKPGHVPRKYANLCKRIRLMEITC